ncbi:hypothetical protein [Winogradskyella sp.]|uniref:hypothetical protein n=1 Tax=Winogradskyella sp. TaxID=1883156 RepID=UPI003BAC178F
MSRFFILYSLLLTSCYSNRNLETEVYNCLDSKINERSVGKSKEFFNYLKELQQAFIDNNYLQDLTKDSYLSFLKKLYNNETLAGEAFKNIDGQVSADFRFNLGTMFVYYKNCHRGLEITNAQTIAKLNSKLEIYDDLESKGFDDYKSFERLIDNTDFRSEKDKQMLLSLIYISVYTKSR